MWVCGYVGVVDKKPQLGGGQLSIPFLWEFVLKFLFLRL